MKPNQSIKAYNPKEIEKKWVDSISISRDFDYSKKVFSLAIPPPNVTGSLHLGHALNSTVQDVLVKYYYLKGFNVQWTPGTDHAGIATQLLVEKSLSKKGLNLKELSNDELIEEIAGNNTLGEEAAGEIDYYSSYLNNYDEFAGYVPQYLQQYLRDLLPESYRILIAGDFRSYNETRRMGLARLNPNGSIDTTFMDTAFNQFAHKR